ncbi:LysR family transcriptional regulator [Pseudomonas aeruginosa]|nr:LysR family transcriptional regulator [Pseudomonas aeruginosa]
MKESLYNVRLLRIFLSVVNNQGFSAAQQELNMSTSAISTYMNQLESQLGMKLCNRGRAGFSLTSKGLLVFEEAKTLIDQTDSFERYVAELKGELRGTITVGILDSMLSDTQVNIPELLGNFSQKSDKIHITLKILSPFELQKEVLEGKVDLAIGSLPTKMSGLRYSPLYIEQHWLYCSDRHPLYKPEDSTVEKVTEHALIKRGYWSNAEAMRHGFTRYSATIDSMEAELILILSGNYIGYLPDHLARRWEDEGRLLRLLPEHFGYTAEFSLIIKNGRSREPLIQAFRDEIDVIFGLDAARTSVRSTT